MTDSVHEVIENAYTRCQWCGTDYPSQAAANRCCDDRDNRWYDRE